jgi:hypothetical protein
MQQLAHLRIVEPPQEDALERRLAPERAERVRERMPTIELHITVGAQHQNAVPRDKSRRMTQHCNRSAVGPMQVVQYDNQRRSLRNRDQQLRGRIQ